MRYFIDELWMVLLYTVLLTISIELITHFMFAKRNKKKTLHTKEEALAEKISITFIFSKTQALKYFYDIIKINFTAKKTTDFIIVSDKKRDTTTFESKGDIQKTISESNEENQKTIVYPFYSYTPISPQDVVEIINKVEKQDCKKIIICGYKIEKDTYKLAEKIQNKKIILLDSFDVYSKIIKQHNLYPENLMDIKPIDKPSLKDILKASLSRKNSKGFLISSLVLLFSSFIVRLNIYYVIISSLLLLFALISFFLPQKTNVSEEEIL